MTPQAIDAWRASEAAAVGPPYLVLGILMVVIAARHCADPLSVPARRRYAGR